MEAVGEAGRHGVRLRESYSGGFGKARFREIEFEGRVYNGLQHAERACVKIS